MIEIGAFEAKDKFSRLLDRVQLGEEVVITRRGKPVAKLVPDPAAAAQALAERKHLRARIGEPDPAPAATSNSH